MKRRAILDYKLFQQNRESQSKTLEFISGINEIRLAKADNIMLKEWKELQTKLFKLNLSLLGVSQMQVLGSAFVNELKNIFITFLSAYLVIKGEISFGVMLSISYIIGQLNSPILDFANFIQLFQNAKLSLERLSEVHSISEEPSGSIPNLNLSINNSSIFLNNVCFKYKGPLNEKILKNVTLEIPRNKTTAIVGKSGSGKTTLLKLLMKFYEPTEGKITIGKVPLSNISSDDWFGECSSVLQEGYLFSDTIANNITMNNSDKDSMRLIRAINSANLKDLIAGLPQGIHTKIGFDGVGLSVGQKQRILIARAIYKNPNYLFLDEATSALDANNEKDIISALNNLSENKTVVIVAHRLSTIKNADQIVVLEKGVVVEKGNHFDLLNKRGYYYELVKNQVEESLIEK